MYCVIQEVKLSKPDVRGNSIAIEPYSWSSGDKVYYSYRMSKEVFKRDIKKAYKISIHKSYRENGKVKKKQWVICTIGHYYMIEWGNWIGDCCRLQDKLEAIGITEDELCNLVYEKLDPLTDKIKSEYKQTEEYIITTKYRKIIVDYQASQREFNSKYGEGYNECYNVFNELVNADRLEEIKREYEARKEYEEKSKRYQEEFYRSCYENNKSNYSNSGYYNNNVSNYSEEEKKLLKEAFKLLSHKHHPDKGGSTKKMAMINNLKEKIL